MTAYQNKMGTFKNKDLVLSIDIINQPGKKETDSLTQTDDNKTAEVIEGPRTEEPMDKHVMNQILTDDSLLTNQNIATLVNYNATLETLVRMIKQVCSFEELLAIIDSNKPETKKRHHNASTENSQDDQDRKEVINTKVIIGNKKEDIRNSTMVKVNKVANDGYSYLTNLFSDYVTHNRVP